MSLQPDHRQRRLALGAAISGLALAGASGCATLERGTTDRVAIVSDPAGATVTAPGRPTCVTPCSIELGRFDETSVTISKPGYVARTVAVKTRVSDAGVGFFMENVVTAGVGGGVDLASGAMLEHDPSPVSVALAPAAAPAPPGKHPSR